MNIIGDIIIGDILHLIEKSPADSAAIALITLSAIRRCDKNFFKGITIFSWLLLIGAALAAFPVFVIFMVTGGDLRLLSAGQVGGSADQIALVFDFLIPCFLVVLPSLLRPRLPWGSDPDRTDVQELGADLARNLGCRSDGRPSRSRCILLREGSWRTCGPRSSSPPSWASCSSSSLSIAFLPGLAGSAGTGWSSPVGHEWEENKEQPGTSSGRPSDQHGVRPLPS